jgi:diguanylate cyclase (GGDEF)-like protein
VVPAFTLDRAGFLWIATGDGLVRYDGYNYRPQLRDSLDPALRNMGWVRALLAGRDGRVWIGTENRGLSAYDPAHDAVRDYGSGRAPLPRDDDSLRALDLPTIRALAEDQAGRIYVGSIGGGLEVFDPASQSFTSFRHTEARGALPDDRVQALLVDRDQNLWVGTWAGLARKRPDAQQFEVIGPGLLSGQRVSALLEDEAGRIWAGTESGRIFRVDGRSGQVSRLNPPALDRPSAAITGFLEVPGGQLWVASTAGIRILDTNSGAVLRYLAYDPRRPTGLAANHVTHLLLDPSGWVWVSGYGLGLQRHHAVNRSIGLREPDLETKSPFSHADIRSMAPAPGGQTWVGTASGVVVRLDPALQPQTPVIKLADPVEALALSRDGSLWAGGQGRVYQYDLQGRHRRTLVHAGVQTRRLFESADGQLWIGTQDGLYRWHRSTAKPVRVVDIQQQPRGEIHSIAQAPDGRIWVGTGQGLFRTSAKGDTLEKPAQQPGENLGSNIVIGLLFDARGTLWVDTGVSGLHRLKNEPGATLLAFDRVSERHGQLGKPFGANLMADDRGRIWTQMHVYAPAADRLVELTSAYGANIGTGWFHAYAQTTDGRMLFGTSKGLLRIRPELFDEATHPAPVHIAELRVNGQRHPMALHEDTLRIGGNVRGFSVEYAALDYLAPERLRYAFRLDGFDEDWTYTGANQRVASYSNLAPGSYTLRIRGTNHSGVWNPEERRLTVHVEPMWWETHWFKALVTLAAWSVVVALVYFRTQQLRRRQRELEGIVRERTAELEAMALELELQRDAMAEASVRDPLTGLHNRRYLLQSIDADIAMALRAHEGSTTYGAALDESHDLQFFIIDIDHFKAINDTHGHETGDAILQQFAERLQSVFRDADYLIRWGGEEFLCVARRSSRRHAAEVAHRICHSINDSPFVQNSGAPIQVSCSVGFACFPLHRAHPGALTWDDVVSIADKAMYLVKKSGRNGWLGFVEHTGASEQGLQDWANLEPGQLIRAPGVHWAASDSVRQQLTRATAP